MAVLMGSAWGRHTWELARMLDISADMVVVTDLDGGIRKISAACQRILGYEPAELVGVQIRSLLHPNDVAASDRQGEELGQGKSVEGARERWRRKDGGYAWVEANAAPLLADLEVHTVIRDVSAHVVAEQRLAQSEQRYRSLFEHNPDGIVLVDLEGRFLDWNPAVEWMMRYTKCEWLGRSFLPLVAPQDQARIQTSFGRVLTGTPQRMELTARRGDGQEIQLELIAVPTVVDETVTGAYAIARDITDQRRAEEALIRQERMYRLLADVSQDTVALHSLEGKISYISPACEMMLGFTPDEMKATHLPSLFHPEDLHQVREAALMTLQGEPHRVSARIRRKSGGYRWFETLLQPICDEQGRVVEVQSSTRDMTEQKAFELRLAHLAYHDAQTGLPNRAAAMNRLGVAFQAARLEKSTNWLMLIDLDDFKRVNDSLGHPVGDALLAQVAQRLQACLGAGDFAARFGGDEFVILPARGSGADDLHALLSRVCTGIETPFMLDGREVGITFSIGLAALAPEHGAPEDLVQDADLALYHAKGQGKARHAFFTPAMRAAAMERLTLETGLRRALERSELQVYYQPIVAAGTSRMAGAEALVRWVHPERGLLLPGHFIAVAEETGLIVPVGRWVLREACRQLKAWQATMPDLADFYVSVNLSPRQLQQPGLVAEVKAILQETGLHPASLQLEITEEALILDAETAVGTLRELRQLGVRIALDDFGTGYSSLSYLRRFPVDMLKVARPFVDAVDSDPEARAILQWVISLARTLRMTVTAEGVETIEQWSELNALGCDKGQGYLFARPVPAGQMEDLLQAAAISRESEVCRKGGGEHAAR